MSITTEPKEKDEEDKNISHLRIPFSKPALGLATQMCRGWGSNPGPSGYRR